MYQPHGDMRCNHCDPREWWETEPNDNTALPPLTVTKVTSKQSEPIAEWWHTPVIPALQRLSGEDHQKFKATVGYIVSSRLAWATCLKKQNNKQKSK